MGAAYQLALLGQPCMLIEQNTSTTHWPKMELTRSRTMELFRKMGLVDELRAQGVPEHLQFDENFSTGYGEAGDRITL
jgi:FAD-dependent monooxygenase